MKYSSLSLVLAAALILFSLEKGNAQIISFDYNDPANGTTSLNSGSAGGSASFLNAAGDPVNLHGSPGSGVSGRTTDHAFNNSASTMGGSGSYSVYANASSLSSLTSLTLAGWFKTETVIGGAANIIAFYGGTTTVKLSADTLGRLTFNLKTPTLTTASSIYSSNTSNAYSKTDEWTFFAVTYDGSAPTGVVRFYAGGVGSPVAQIGSNMTIAGSGALGTITGNVSLGGTSTRAFAGLLDNFEIHGALLGSSGALSLSELESIRESAFAVPEPYTATLLSALLIGGAILRRYHRRA